MAIQILDFVPKSGGWIMQYAVEHYHAGETTSPIPITQGYDDKCSGVNVATHFGRSFDLESDHQEQIHCALYFYSRRKQSALSVFEAGECVPLHSVLFGTKSSNCITTCITFPRFVTL
jgi:hypothetical protein